MSLSISQSKLKQGHSDMISFCSQMKMSPIFILNVAITWIQNAIFDHL